MRERFVGALCRNQQRTPSFLLAHPSHRLMPDLLCAPSLRRALFLAVAPAILLGAQSIGAQQTADVIRGRVVNDSGKIVVGATVIITRGPDRATQQTLSDSAGNYTVRFDPGTGDYLVYIASPGLKSARRRVQREQI